MPKAPVQTAVVEVIKTDEPHPVVHATEPDHKESEVQKVPEAHVEAPVAEVIVAIDEVAEAPVPDVIIV